MSAPELEPRDDESDDLAIRGEIESSSVPELIRSFLASGETGVLTFRNGEQEKKLYLDAGRVVGASSKDPDERLGESLLVRGKITARQYLDASQQIGPGRRLGAILVEMGAIEAEELAPSVEQQVRDILAELMTWTRGEYELVFRDIDPNHVLPVNISIENAIMDGLRRTEAWSQILRGIGGIHTVPARTGGDEALLKLELSDEEQELLSHVSGHSSVEHICQVSYLSNFETCRTLYAFKVLGVIRIGEGSDAVVLEREREMDLEAIVEKYNQMFSRIYGFLQGRIGEDADAFMQGALEDVSRQYGALFDGVDLRQYGRADFEQMLANVADLPAAERRSLMVSALNELVFAVQLQAQKRKAPQEEAVISGIIKDGLRRVAPG